MFPDLEFDESIFVTDITISVLIHPDNCYYCWDVYIYGHSLWIMDYIFLKWRISGSAIAHLVWWFCPCIFSIRLNMLPSGQSLFLTRIFCRRISRLTTDCPWRVCCRGLITWLLCESALLGAPSFKQPLVCKFDIVERLLHCLTYDYVIFTAFI